jgi:hypothetical protein
MDGFLPVDPEPAEVFTGDSPVVADFWSAPSVPFNNIAPRSAEGSLQRAEISA